MEAADSRLGAPPNREVALAAPVRRNGQASPFSVAVSRLGAPGGAVVGGALGRSPSTETAHGSGGCQREHIGLAADHPRAISAVNSPLDCKPKPFVV